MYVYIFNLRHKDGMMHFPLFFMKPSLQRHSFFCGIGVVSGFAQVDSLVVTWIYSSIGSGQITATKKRFVIKNKNFETVHIVCFIILSYIILTAGRWKNTFSSISQITRLASAFLNRRN